jgi:hypothetical protein
MKRLRKLFLFYFFLSHSACRHSGIFELLSTRGSTGAVLPGRQLSPSSPLTTLAAQPYIYEAKEKVRRYGVLPLEQCCVFLEKI